MGFERILNFLNLCTHIRCATTQISAKLHILFQFTKSSFCLDASVYSKKNSFIRKNPF